MDVNPNTLWSVAERSVTAPVGRTRSELIRLLGQLKFSISTDQLTLVEAVRGSKIAGGTKDEAKVPVMVRLRLTGTDGSAGAGTTTVVIEQQDTWLFPTRRPFDVYGQIFTENLADLDDALRRVDPRAAEFPAPRVSPQLYQVTTSAGSGAISQAADRFLNAQSAATPRGWRASGDVVLMTPRAMAVLPAEAVYGMVTVGALVASRPGPMPAPLVAQVEKLTSAMEQLLQQAGQVPPNVIPPTVWLELENAAIPVVEFLAQQSRIREEVALRSLQVCVTCRLAKVINPDYTRLRNRRNRVNVLTGSVGAFIGPAGISPFVLIGRLAQLNQLDPEFVCPRCQGLHAESTLITFCPRCGQQCDDSALRACGKCSFDYRSLARTRDLWQDPPTPEELAPAGVSGWAPDAQAWVPDAAGGVSPDWAPPTDPRSWAPPTPPGPTGSTAAATVTSAAAAGPVVSTDEPGPVPQTIGEFAHLSFERQPAAGGWAAPDPGSAATPPAWTAAEPTSFAVAEASGEQGSAFQGWYPDPHGRHQHRWWDGFAWTDHVANDGVTATDPY